MLGSLKKEKLPLHKFSKYMLQSVQGKAQTLLFPLGFPFLCFLQHLGLFLQKSHYTQYNCPQTQVSLSILHLSDKVHL